MSYSARIAGAVILGSLHHGLRIGVALGLAGGFIQAAFAPIRPSQPASPVLRTVDGERGSLSSAWGLIADAVLLGRDGPLAGSFRTWTKGA